MSYLKRWFTVIFSSLPTDVLPHLSRATGLFRMEEGGGGEGQKGAESCNTF